MRTAPQIPNALPELAAVIEGDRRFFARHADRDHRVRHLSRAELDAFAAEGRLVPKQPPGWRWFVAVKRVPGGRIRAPFGSPHAAEVDLSEQLARGLFHAAMDNAETGAGYGIIPPEAL